MRILIIIFLLFYSLNANAQTVYKTPKGEKYHTSDCRFAANAEAISVKQAIKIGLEACKVCKPGGATGSQSVQCKGKTQSGARCKNITKNPAGYCHHHD